MTTLGRTGGCRHGPLSYSPLIGVHYSGIVCTSGAQYAEGPAGMEMMIRDGAIAQRNGKPARGRTVRTKRLLVLARNIR